MRELDNMAIQAAGDKYAMDEFIKKNQFFILKCAYTATHRYITKSDDEWSLALLAFTQSVQSYNLTRGSFLRFSQLVIRRKLIDYHREQSKYNQEISVNPDIFDTEPDDDDENISIRIAVSEQVSQNQDDSLKYEIEAANQAFSHYGFSFFDLAECSPKAEKTKMACAKAVVYILKNPLLISELYRSKQLPIKIIEKNSNVPRKILERHRKYIIAAVEILSEEYPVLAEYMRFIREELNK